MYLGHIILLEGVWIDPMKVTTVENWSLLTMAKQVWAFLRLTSYYRRFINRYAQIVGLIAVLLKKKNFHWRGSANNGILTIESFPHFHTGLVGPGFLGPLRC